MTDKELIQDAMDTSIHQMMNITVRLQHYHATGNIVEILADEFEIDPFDVNKERVVFRIYDKYADQVRIITVYPAE